MEEEYYRVKLGDMYVKDFKMNAVNDSKNHWKVKRELTLTNSEEEGIPILKEDAQGLMKLLDKSAVLSRVD